jgi:geranylgeranyl pyrophosphate synthase
MSAKLDRLLSLLDQEETAPIHRMLLDFLGSNEVIHPEDNRPYLLIPELCCQALGGNHRLAEGVIIAWEALCFAAHLLDLVADADEFETHRGLFATVAAACIPAGRILLEDYTPSCLRKDALAYLVRDFDRAIMSACAGQVMDLTEAEPSLERCWEISSRKTGEIYALAARSGARLATENQDLIEILNNFGLHLGILIQIEDDINGLWSHKDDRSDIARGKWTLPVAYAFQVLSPLESKRLKEQMTFANQHSRLEDTARRTIIESGALVYLAAEAEKHYRKAQNAIIQADLADDGRRELIGLLDHATSWLSNDENQPS